MLETLYKQNQLTNPLSIYFSYHHLPPHCLRFYSNICGTTKPAQKSKYPLRPSSK